MKIVFRRIILLSSIVALALPAAPIAAAGADSGEGIPAMSVARLKVNKGTAWVRPADSGEWQEYGTNTPLAERSRVSVPSGSEAAIVYRGGQSLVLRGGAEVEIRELGEKHDTFRLQSGSVALSLPEGEFAPVRFRVPGNREVDIAAPGRYSLAADGGRTKFLVSAGEGTVSGEGTAAVAVKAGEEATIGEKVLVGRAESTAPAPAGPVAEAPLTDAEREAGIPPEAASELRDYGNWVYTPEYGYVWNPYVADGWTPYFYGHWVWVYPYGWVWVAYEPWGWWPYHFGWWIDYPAFGWVWCPFHSFASVSFRFGHSRFFFHSAFFFGANVRFAHDGRFIRWTPARPGTTATTATFARGDTRLSQWNRPLARGTVMVRAAGGRLSAWDGRRSASAGAAMAGRSAPQGRGPGRAFAEGGGRVSALAPAPGAAMGGSPDRRGIGETARSPRGSAVPRGFSGSRAIAPRPGTVAPRAFGGFGSFRGAPPPRSSGGGAFRGFEGGADRFGNGGFRGFGGGGFRGGRER